MAEMTTADVQGARGLSEGLDEHASEVLSAAVTASSTAAATLGRSRAHFNEDIRAELQYAVNMRQLGQRYSVSPPVLKVHSLLWRLVLAVTIVVSIAACGLMLSIAALLDTSVKPNPYVAFTLLLVGLSLCATVATAVHGDRPRLRRR